MVWKPSMSNFLMVLGLKRLKVQSTRVMDVNLRLCYRVVGYFSFMWHINLLQLHCFCVFLLAIQSMMWEIFGAQNCSSLVTNVLKIEWLFRHFWREKNFTWKSHLRPSCTKPFNKPSRPLRPGLKALWGLASKALRSWYERPRGKNVP